MRAMRKLTFICITFILIAMLSSVFTLPSKANPETISIGPWIFEDQAFADDATDISAENSAAFYGLDSTNDALCFLEENYQDCIDLVLTEEIPAIFQQPVPGNELTFLRNTGFTGSTSNWFQLDFTDIKAENNLGTDIVLFECHYADDDDAFEIAVRPEGGSFTEFVTYDISKFQETDTSCDDVSGHNWGAPINLSDFGIEGGTIVDAIQFKCIDPDPLDPDVHPECDPTMAAVLLTPPIHVFLPIISR